MHSINSTAPKGQTLTLRGAIGALDYLLGDPASIITPTIDTRAG